MKPERQEFFRELLKQRKLDLSDGVKGTVDEMSDEEETFPDPNDRASLESDRNFTLRIRDRERKLKSKIEKAIARIDDGTFGTCEECGEDISEGRLKARPVTTMCIQCKEEQERQEKAKQS
ncbi:MAG: RNA polymerase-binding protein DksA [Deltaproteobacteria bacterium]|nr:RNA polymerase-binding protein DksA [Deltaproteobacteria bacterium]